MTGDETWVYSWDPELKRQSAQWRNQGSPRPEKARRKQGAMKVMHIVFFDAAGVLVNWAVPAGTTINAAYYKWVLQERKTSSSNQEKAARTCGTLSDFSP